jgi:saccharopine dehydrogenase-like NADP-dependent oxidoreductase
MSRVIVLGGCGNVGIQAVKALVATKDFDEIVIADINVERADKYVEEIGDSRLSSLKVDLTHSAMITDTIKDAVR